jgi:hypothetical protein
MNSQIIIVFPAPVGTDANGWLVSTLLSNAFGASS